MKSILFLLLLYPVLSFGKKTNPTNIADSMIPFHVILYSGDERVDKYELNVYRKAHKFYAEISAPGFSNDNQIDSGWTVELDNEKTLACLRFLNKAKTFPKENIDPVSSWRENYEITYTNDTIRLEGHYDWGSLDFIKLLEFLFKKQLSDKEVKKKDLKLR